MNLSVNDLPQQSIPLFLSIDRVWGESVRTNYLHLQFFQSIFKGINNFNNSIWHLFNLPLSTINKSVRLAFLPSARPNVTPVACSFSHSHLCFFLNFNFLMTPHVRGLVCLMVRKTLPSSFRSTWLPCKLLFCVCYLLEIINLWDRIDPKNN